MGHRFGIKPPFGYARGKVMGDITTLINTF